MSSSHTSDSPPEGTSIVRILPADVQYSESRCPQRLAMKIRPGSPRPSRAAASGPTLTSWALGPLHDVLDLIEFEQLPAESALAKWRAAPKRPVHPALARWTEHAVHGYLAAAAAIPASATVPYGEPLEPVSRMWARQRGPLKPGDPDVHEEMVAERRYAGHGVRELRIVRAGSVRDRPQDKAEIAMAVGVLASGRPVLSSRWSKSRLTLGRFEPARLVRLVEIGCVDASQRILFEGTPDEAYARYDSDVEAHIGKVIAGDSYRPGKQGGVVQSLGPV